jgi:hypothetical protein
VLAQISKEGMQKPLLDEYDKVKLEIVNTPANGEEESENTVPTADNTKEAA